jgi:CheY-like chemotaxis protein
MIGCKSKLAGAHQPLDQSPQFPITRIVQPQFLQQAARLHGTITSRTDQCDNLLFQIFLFHPDRITASAIFGNQHSFQPATLLSPKCASLDPNSTHKIQESFFPSFPTQRTAMDTAPAWKRDQRQPRVLIVDDDFEIIEAVRYALEEQGYEVLVARDGNQGLAMAEQVQPDLMLLDMMMPKRSGFLVLESLHRASLPPMRIIMMTANEGERHKAYAEMLGVDDYLRKPLAIDRLMASVRHWLEEPFTDTQAS